MCRSGPLEKGGEMFSRAMKLKCERRERGRGVYVMEWELVNLVT
jgi:hypothetical protein